MRIVRYPRIFNAINNKSIINLDITRIVIINICFCDTMAIGQLLSIFFYHRAFWINKNTDKDDNHDYGQNISPNKIKNKFLSYVTTCLDQGTVL